MVKQEILMRAIVKIKKAGCKEFDYINDVVSVNEKFDSFEYLGANSRDIVTASLNDIFFSHSHSFAKALWGNGHQVCKQCASLNLFMNEDGEICCTECCEPVEVIIVSDWKEHLKELLLIFDWRIDYLEKYID